MVHGTAEQHKAEVQGVLRRLPELLHRLCASRHWHLRVGLLRRPGLEGLVQLLVQEPCLLLLRKAQVQGH